MASPVARVLSVNVGAVRTVEHHGRDVATAIWKAPVEGRVATAGVNLAGDDQADRDNHGGPDRAVYAYAGEDLDSWAAETGVPMPPGSVGENLTTSGLDVTAALVGERWRAGSVLFEVSSPRVPCFKLGMRTGQARFVQHFARAGRPGAYLRIIEHGDVAAGDAIEVVFRPDHDVSVGLVARAYHDDRTLAPALLAAPALTAGWRDWALRHG